MLNALRRVDVGTKTKIIIVLAFLVGLNVFLWLLTWQAAHRYAFLFAGGGQRLSLITAGAAFAAYGFGLRHAVDADHISAIDNTTRKLMQEGKRPVCVGLFFSLGHSTIVLLLCAALALSSAYVQKHLPQWHNMGGIVGTFISAFFLYVIGFINLVVLWGLYRQFRDMAQGKNVADQQVTDMLNQRGLIGRLFRPLFRMIRHSWQMYFIGFLFGLGFDTASEVGILALSASSGQSGIPFWVIMLLPLLFMAGMCLVDALDGILMLGAYGWAFIKPIRKAYYNLSITVLSVLVAFVVGTYELLQVLGVGVSFPGRFFNNLGFVIIGTFLLGWAVSVLIYKFKNYEAAGS